MKKDFTHLLLIAIATLSVQGRSGVWAASLPDDQSAIIESEGRCVESKGIPIGDVPDDQARLACLRDSSVQQQCDFDGHHARLQAFKRWEGALMHFQEQCQSQGGTFGFAAPEFQEPRDESFCTMAEPEVRYGNFEDPLCNFVSRCPPVAVVCRYEEDPTVSSAERTVLLPGVPLPLRLIH